MSEIELEEVEKNWRQQSNIRWKKDQAQNQAQNQLQSNQQQQQDEAQSGEQREGEGGGTK